MSRFLTIALVALLIAGCTTRRIVDHEIPVPPGLTDAEVERAVMEFIEGTRQLPGTLARPYHTDPGFTAANWSLQDCAPGHCVAVLRTESYQRGPIWHRVRTLRIGIWHSAQGVRTRIIDASSDLKYDGERVHKTALKWHDGMDRRLARELQWAAASKQKGRR